MVEGGGAREHDYRELKETIYVLKLNSAGFWIGQTSGGNSVAHMLQEDDCIIERSKRFPIAGTGYGEC